MLPAFDLINHARGPFTIELHKRKRITAMLGEPHGNDRKGQRMRPARYNITNRSFQLFPIIQSVAEYYLRMVIRSRFFQFCELPKDICRSFISEHFSTQYGIRTLYGNVERRQVKALDA